MGKYGKGIQTMPLIITHTKNYERNISKFIPNRNVVLQIGRIEVDEKWYGGE